MIKVPNTLQEVFNIVSKHLLDQGQKSIEFGMCQYRGSNGMKCAAGALIPDNEYNSSFETNLWGDLVEKGIVENKFVDEIDKLQVIHDFGPSDPEECVSTWKRKLIKFAEEHNLTHNIE